MLYSSSSSDDSEDTLLESSSASHAAAGAPNYKMAAIQYGFNNSNSTQNSKNDTNKNNNSYNRRRRKRMTSVSSIGSNSSAYNNLDSGYFSPYICSVCFNPYQTSSTGSTNSTYSPYMIGIGGPRCCCEPALVGSEHCDIIKAIPTTTPNKLPCPRRESCQDLINTTCYNNYANASGGRIKRNLFSFENLEQCGGFTDNLLEGSGTSIDQIITTEIIKTNNLELTKVNKRVNKDDLKLTQPNQSSLFLRRQKSKSPDFLTPQQQPLSSNVLLIRKNGGVNPEIHYNQNNVKSSISGFSKIENPASQPSKIHLKADFHTFLAKESRKVGPAAPTPHHRLHLNPNVKTERVFLECKSSFELHNEYFATPATKNNKTRRGTDPGKRLNEKIELFGTKLRALGDEFESSLTTKNGGSFLRRSQNGGVCYANNIDNALNRQNSVPKLKYFLHQMLNQILNNILFQ